MRRLWIWLLALLTLLISGAGRILGIVAGLFVAGVVVGYAWGWGVVVPQVQAFVVEDED